MTKAEERISFSKLSVNEVASRLSVVLGNLLPAVDVHHCLVDTGRIARCGHGHPIRISQHHEVHDALSSCWGPNPFLGT